VDLTYPPETESFRSEVRSWLRSQLPDDWEQVRTEMPPAERQAFFTSWTAKLHDGGWICATWPKEFGGRGLSTMEGVVLAEEFARVGAPMRADFFGDTLVGPTILRWGTDEQKSRFLPGILCGETAWCQGFSEPDAGSDLASLRTTAVRDGDQWVIHGQKVWTSGAHVADYCFLMARTNKEVSKHKGISYLLVPMDQPGITIRPIVQIDGAAEFNEVHFDGARCRIDNVIGGVDNGWAVAMTTLGFERGTSSTTGHRRFAMELDRIIHHARSSGRVDDPVIRQRLASAWTRVKILEINGLRALSDVLHGTTHAKALGPTAKLFWSEHHQATTELALDVIGMESQVLAGAVDEQFVPGVGLRRSRPGYPVSELQGSFFFARSETIWGGTSEVQRDLVAERFLGLPKKR
jgi:alkylation response protein AidB-like acyl-CoA dehydrogenase